MNNEARLKHWGNTNTGATLNTEHWGNNEHWGNTEHWGNDIRLCNNATAALAHKSL